MTPPSENPFRTGAAAETTAVSRYASALQAATEAAGDINPATLSKDDAITLATAYRDFAGSKGAGRDLESGLRRRLWELVGGLTGQFRTTDGRQFKFRRVAKVRRSVKYADLQSKFPEAYDTCVTETAVDPDTPAALYL